MPVERAPKWYLPVAIVVVDTRERITAFLPQIQELVTGGLVLVEPVEVVSYVGQHDDGPAEPS
jgi:PII-like signaling protein